MATKYISGAKREILVPVDSAIVIETGDLVYLNTDDARPLSGLSDSGTKAQNQAAAHDVFLGIALQPSQDGQTRPIQVATAGIWEFDATSGTYEIGDYVGPEGTGSAGAVGVSASTVVGVANSTLCVGKVARRGTTVTRVRVAIQSTILNDVSFAGDIEADTLTITGDTILAGVTATSLICPTLIEGVSGEGVAIDGGKIRDGQFIAGQGAPTAETTTGPTLTAAELFGGLITSTQTGAVTATLDTGTAMDTALAAAVAVDKGFYWSLINLGSASGAATVTQAAAGHTVVGAGLVAINTTGRFFSRRTATNTWITYRVA